MKRPWRRRISADIDQAIGNVTWCKPPAPEATPLRAPGPNPGPGTTISLPVSDTPGPGPTCTISVDFYTDGSSVIRDHIRRRRYRIRGAALPPIDLSDAALEEFLRGQG